MTKSPATKRARRRAALALLREHFPLAFPADNTQVRPLAIGTGHQLAAWAEAHGHDFKGIRLALQKYCGRNAYQQALCAEEAQRINLDGEPVEPVSPEHHARAEQSLRDAEKRREEKAARLARHLAAEAQRQAEAARKQAKPAAKPVRQAKAPPPAPAAKAAPVVVVKKRRVVTPG